MLLPLRPLHGQEAQERVVSGSQGYGHGRKAQSHDRVGRIMIARIAYLTSPAPGMFLLNFQIENGVELSIEVSKGHLANILIDGTALALRDSIL
jgi:hypothetical protein